MNSQARRGLGAAGESHARRHLERQGYQFVTANWHCRYGELDLILRDGEMLVFVEVKTRRGELRGLAEEAVTPAKTQRLLTAAQLFLSEHPALAALIWRVDLVAITLGPSGNVTRLTHVVDAIRDG